MFVCRMLAPSKQWAFFPCHTWLSASRPLQRFLRRFPLLMRRERGRGKQRVLDQFPMNQRKKKNCPPPPPAGVTGGLTPVEDSLEVGWWGAGPAARQQQAGAPRAPRPLVQPADWIN